jgi:hypothetical protein
MKWNSTIGLTLILLAAMLGAGIMSAMAGMKAGREALKGITQPDTRPTNNLAKQGEGSPKRDELVILQEDKIIASVKERMATGSGVNPAAKPAPAPVKEPQAAKFPMSSESDGIILQVNSVQFQGDSLAVSVSLQNSSNDPIKFLYSFLEIKDDQGQTLSTTTEGLPSELPPASQPYPGTIRIPANAVDQSTKLSLSLADYPDQQVQIQMANIPITR